MVSVRKVTGRERGRFRPHDVKPRMVSRMGIYSIADETTALNLAFKALSAGEVSQLGGGTPFADNNILIHWIKAINIGAGITAALTNQTKRLHFWCKNDSTDAANEVFSLTVPPSDKERDGGLATDIEFPIPLLIEGGCVITGTSAGSNEEMHVTVCYTVLNSLTVGDSSIKYKFLTAATTDQAGDNAVPKLGGTATKASTAVTIPPGGGGDTIVAVELDIYTTTRIYVPADGTDDFASSGTLLINGEEITYTGKGSNYFTIGVREYNGTYARTHLVDTVIDELHAIDTNASNNTLNLDGVAIDLTSPTTYTCAALATKIETAMTGATTYDVNVDPNNNRRVIFTDKTAGAARNIAFVGGDKVYFSGPPPSGTNTVTLSIPALTGGDDKKFYTEDIEIWGVSCMNLLSTFGTSRLATAHVKNCHGDKVAEIAIFKDDRNSFDIPWIGIKGGPFVFPPFCRTGLNTGNDAANQSDCETGTSYEWIDGSYNPSKWLWSYEQKPIGGGRNSGSDTYVQFFRFPIYCRGDKTLGAGAALNFRIGVDADDKTRATWFFRPVKAQGLNHGWV